MKFSEKYGFTPVRSVLQTNSMDDGLRNRLWNLLCGTYFATSPKFQGNADYLPNRPDVERTFHEIWHHHFKKTTDSIGLSYIEALADLRELFFKVKWYEVYDLVQFLAEFDPMPQIRVEFIDGANDILNEELSGYRFISGQIVQITSEEEVAEIERALSVPDSLKPVREHLKQALTLLSNKTNPDYRNSIKESILSVESMSKIIAKLPKTTLGPALAALEKKIALHPSLKEGFQKLYGYTSDAQGIRHALMDEPNLDIEDAKFMLVSCSAFVNYLVVKAQKAGIAI
jgi:hypothetical protein